MVEIEIAWRGEFTNTEVNALHMDAFGDAAAKASERDWVSQVDCRSMGWVTARATSGALVGFVNVVTDGHAHAWIQDVMVASSARHRGIGARLVNEASDRCRLAGCEWLHVDFDKDLAPFYFDACGFTPTTAGLIRLD